MSTPEEPKKKPTAEPDIDLTKMENLDDAIPFMIDKNSTKEPDVGTVPESITQGKPAQKQR